MQLKVRKLHILGDKEIYSGPVLETNYGERRGLIGMSRADDTGIEFRFDWPGHSATIVLTRGETIRHYRDLVMWMESIIKDLERGEK